MAPQGDDNGDLGESDDITASAATTEQEMNTQVEKEAQSAAKQVLKSTMKAVEHDFLFSEKAITKRLSMKKAPKLTLKSLEVKGGKSKAQKAKAKAKKQYKE